MSDCSYPKCSPWNKKYEEVYKSLRKSFIKQRDELQQLKQLTCFFPNCSVINCLMMEKDEQTGVFHVKKKICQSCIEKGTDPMINNSNEKMNENQERELKVIQGGKTPPGGEWLSGMVGKTILVRNKYDLKDCGLREYEVLETLGKAVRLMAIQTSGEFSFWVDPIRFCEVYSFYEEIKDGDIQEGTV